MRTITENEKLRLPKYIDFIKSICQYHMKLLKEHGIKPIGFKIYESNGEKCFYLGTANYK